MPVNYTSNSRWLLDMKLVCKRGTGLFVSYHLNPLVLIVSNAFRYFKGVQDDPTKRVSERGQVMLSFVFKGLTS